MRKFFALVLCSMVLGLVGCGEEAKKPEEKKAPATPATGDKKEAPPADKKPEEKK